MNRIKSAIIMFFQVYKLPLLTTLLLSTSYIPFPPWAAFFGLAPLMLFWYQNAHSLKRVFWGGWIFQFVLSLTGTHWVYITAKEFGQIPAPLSLLILLAFSSFAHIYYPLAGLMWAWLQRKLKIDKKITLIAMPLIFLIFESFAPTLFFWHFGFSWLYIKLPGMQLADIIGFYGLNIITIFINYLVLLFLIYKDKMHLMAAGAVFLIINGLGLVRGAALEKPTENFNTLIVQANIGNNIKVSQDKGPYYHDFILNKFLDLTQQGLVATPNPDMILWPETAYPDLIHARPKTSLQVNLMRFISGQQKPLFTGAYQNRNGQSYNTLSLLDRNGQFVDSYSKTHLLAFGEYVPGRSLFPKLQQMLPMVANFGRGKGPSIIEFEGRKFGAQICYESMSADFSAKLNRLGAQMIINVTNDSWFGRYFEPYQHLYTTMARSIEFRTPLVRSTNTGISTTVSVMGKAQEFSPVHKEWVGTLPLKYYKSPKRTIYSYYAGYWKWILLLACIGFYLGAYFAKPRKP